MMRLRDGRERVLLAVFNLFISIFFPNKHAGKNYGI